MAQDIHVKGLKELAHALDTLPTKMSNNILRSGMRRGAKEIMEEVKRNAPVGAPNAKNARLYGGRAGLLRDSVRVGTGVRKGVVKAVVKVGGKAPGGGDAYYAIMVEFGTGAHTIASKKGGPMYVNGFFTKVVMHPGARPKPFVRPAMLAKSGAAVRAAGEYVKARLQEKDIKGLDRLDIVVDDEGI